MGTWRRARPAWLRSRGPPLEELKSAPTVREAVLYEKLGGDAVRCGVCERRCVMAPAQKGSCKTKVNIDGELYTLTYGDLSAQESRPIEIKPFFAFWPGSTALTISTKGCNFHCPWCQNHHLSRMEPNPASAIHTPPEEVVEGALRARDEGLCVSFNEPTLLFEYSLDLFKLASEKGLYSTYVSNGYMTEEALGMLHEAGMDAIKIDIKGGQEAYQKHIGGADADVPWRNAKLAKDLGMHVEIVNLMVTGVNDSEEDVEQVIQKHLKLLGPKISLHFTKYYPAHEFHAPPTPVRKLQKARGMAMNAGIEYVYTGNVPGDPGENTYCPKCGQLLIKRFGSSILGVKLTPDKKCPSCGHEIPITGEIIKKRVGRMM